MNETTEFKWNRPETLDYPKVWHTFKAKDTDTDNLVDYRIEDLTESRIEEVLSILVKYFLTDEPLCNAVGITGDTVAVSELVKLLWTPVIKQRMVLVCQKTGSNEIVALNMNFVATKDEHFFEHAQKNVLELELLEEKKYFHLFFYLQFKSDKNVRQFITMGLVYENFDIFEHYGIDKYLSSAGLLVTPNYRGRRIGEQFLMIRGDICREFGIKLTATIFTSDFSNRIADKVGFKLDISLSFNEIHKRHPELGLDNVKSEDLSLKSILF